MSYRFSPTPQSLQELHKTLFQDSEFAFTAGQWRTLPLKGGKTVFAPAYQVPSLIDELFAKKRTTLVDIIDWTVSAVGYIHPFLDGNRRTCWQFANLWLIYLCYPPINWEYIRPYWEADIQKDIDLEERIQNITLLLS